MYAGARLNSRIGNSRERERRDDGCEARRRDARLAGGGVCIERSISLVA